LRVFVDTGGWLSVINEADQYHRAGSAYFQGLIQRRGVAFTTDFVLDETITRLRYDAGHRKATAFLHLIRRSVNVGTLIVLRIGEDHWREAEAIFLRHADARLSFTDCTSFAILREDPVDEVFGYDAHFEMMGYILGPKP